MFRIEILSCDVTECVVITFTALVILLFVLH